MKALCPRIPDPKESSPVTRYYFNSGRLSSISRNANIVLRIYIIAETLLTVEIRIFVVNDELYNGWYYNHYHLENGALCSQMQRCVWGSTCLSSINKGLCSGFWKKNLTAAPKASAVFLEVLIYYKPWLIFRDMGLFFELSPTLFITSNCNF